MKTHSKWKPISTALLLTFLAAAWALLAPSQLGGRASYIIVNGASMEPSMRKGDLVIVHPAPAYRSGDVVTYQDPRLGPVIHRIIRTEGNSFVLKGDNNSWVDSYKPTQPELIGKLWLRVPSAGKLISIVRSPLNMALFMGVATVISLSLLTPRKTRRDKSRQQRQAANGRQTPGLLGETGQAVLTILLAPLFGSLLLAFLSYGRAGSRAVSDNLAYQHTAEFGYSAAVPAGVYNADRVATGEPVFRKLTDVVTVQFKYRLQSDQPRDVAGTYRLNAEIRDASGWKRTIPLGSETGFRGDSFAASGTVDLGEVQALLDGVEARTGVEHPDYILSVAPEVLLKGKLAGQKLEDEFSPRLDFRLDPLQLQLLSSASADANPFKPVEQGFVQRSRTEPNRISLPYLDLSVATARWLATLGLVLSVSGLLVLGLLALRALTGGEASRIRSRYARMLVDVHGTGAGSDARIMEVARFEDLARIAGKDGRMILHETDGDTDRYYLQEGDLTYVYRASATDDRVAVLERGVA